MEPQRYTTLGLTLRLGPRLAVVSVWGKLLSSWRPSLLYPGSVVYAVCYRRTYRTLNCSPGIWSRQLGGIPGGSVSIRTIKFVSVDLPEQKPCCVVLSSLWMAKCVNLGLWPWCPFPRCHCCCLLLENDPPYTFYLVCTPTFSHNLRVRRPPEIKRLLIRVWQKCIFLENFALLFFLCRNIILSPEKKFQAIWPFDPFCNHFLWKFWTFSRPLPSLHFVSPQVFPRGTALIHSGKLFSLFCVRQNLMVLFSICVRSLTAFGYCFFFSECFTSCNIISCCSSGTW